MGMVGTTVLGMDMNTLIELLGCRLISFAAYIFILREFGNGTMYLYCDGGATVWGFGDNEYPD